MIEWSRKQYALYMMAEHQADTYVVHGPIRSGKTMPAVHGFARFACMNFAGHDFGLAARSGKQLDAVPLAYLREFARLHGMTLRSGKYGYLLDSWLHGPPNQFIPLIGDDVSAAAKADSFTFAGALADGCHDMPQQFVDVVQERCTSVEGSKFVAVCNPENPQHWFKKNLVDQADGELVLDFPFQLSDNETLTPKQVERMYRIYPPGPMRDRRIFGKWVATEGKIYPFYADAVVKSVPPHEVPYRHSISIDHADSSVTHAIRFDWYRDGIYAAAEWRHDGNEDGQLKDVQQAHRLYRKLVGVRKSKDERNIADWYCDPSAIRFSVELGNLIGKRVRPAENDVALGIEKTGQWMAAGSVKITRDCPYLIHELDNYRWDPKAAARGEDKPIKKDDHGCDAFRYFCFTTSKIQSDQRKRPRIVRANQRRAA